MTRGTGVEAHLGGDVLSSAGSVRARAERGAASGGLSARARARGTRVPARLAAPAAMADVAILLSADYDSCAYNRRDLR